MRLGRNPQLVIELQGSSAFPPFLIADPSRDLLNGLPSGTVRPIATARRLVRLLRDAGANLAWKALAQDFVNSVANLTLNQLLVLLPDGARGPEPAWDGHTYYPFPGLRIGPSVEEVAACSNLNAAPVRLRLAICPGLIRWEAVNSTFTESKWKAELGEAIALHPWHLAHSRVVRELVRDGHIHLLDDTVAAMPLASQRTCRLESGLADLKMALDATLTGEHRLLYQFNVANAPVMSALVCHLLTEAPVGALAAQPDVASVSHPVPGIGPHLAMIVRAPLDQQDGVLWPATSLWSGGRLAGDVFGLSDGVRVEELWNAYCRLVIEGPALMWARWGIGLEPHLQNTLVGTSGRVPARLVVRDLDSTLLEEQLCRPQLAALHLALAPNSWAQMPAEEFVAARLAHALYLGHLATVGGLLIREFGAEPLALMTGLQDAWAQVREASSSAAERSRLAWIEQLAGRTKLSLHMRLERSMQLRFAPQPPNSAQVSSST